MESIAVHRKADSLFAEFQRIPFARYAPVRRQLQNPIRMINGKSEPHGHELVQYTPIGLRRFSVKIYKEVEILDTLVEASSKQIVRNEVADKFARRQSSDVIKGEMDAAVYATHSSLLSRLLKAGEISCHN